MQLRGVVVSLCSLDSAVVSPDDMPDVTRCSTSVARLGADHVVLVVTVFCVTLLSINTLTCSRLRGSTRGT